MAELNVLLRDVRMGAMVSSQQIDKAKAKVRAKKSAPNRPIETPAASPVTDPPSAPATTLPDPKAKIEKEIVDRARELNATRIKTCGQSVFTVGWIGTGVLLGFGWLLSGAAAKRLDIDRAAILAAGVGLAVLLLLCYLASQLLKARATSTTAPVGMVTMLIGRDGRLSTSHFQAWVWTLVLVWAFVFFIARAGISRDLASIASVTPTLGTGYLLLLVGPSEFPQR